MPKRSSKKSRLPDPNKLAFAIVQHVTGQAPAEQPTESATNGTNPAAVALGRLGGMKGGKARAASLSAKKRVEIARKAAAARWKQATKSDNLATLSRHS